MDFAVAVGDPDGLEAGQPRLHSSNVEQQIGTALAAGGRKHEVAHVAQCLDVRRHKTLELQQHVVFLPRRFRFEQ